MSPWQLLSSATVILVLLAAAPSMAQMNIESIVITSGPAYRGGVFTDFFLEPELTGTGIASVTLTRQNGASISLVEDSPGTWGCGPGDCEFFPTLQDIRDLGNLTFTLSGTSGESDSIAVPFADWDPGAGQAGFPVITAPSFDQTGVSLMPTFSWNAPPAWVDIIFAEVLLLVPYTGVDSAELPGTATSWAPSLLSEGADHDFELAFFGVFIFEDPRISPVPQSDAYLFSSGFQAFNFVSFRTAGSVPLLGGVGMTALVVGLIASGRSALRRQRPGRS